VAVQERVGDEPRPVWQPRHRLLDEVTNDDRDHAEFDREPVEAVTGGGDLEKKYQHVRPDQRIGYEGEADMADRIAVVQRQEHSTIRAVETVPASAHCP